MEVLLLGTIERMLTDEIEKDLLFILPHLTVVASRNPLGLVPEVLWTLMDHLCDLHLDLQKNGMGEVVV